MGVKSTYPICFRFRKRVGETLPAGFWSPGPGSHVRPLQSVLYDFSVFPRLSQSSHNITITHCSHLLSLMQHPPPLQRQFYKAVSRSFTTLFCVGSQASCQNWPISHSWGSSGSINPSLAWAPYTPPQVFQAHSNVLKTAWWTGLNHQEIIKLGHFH